MSNQPRGGNVLVAWNGGREAAHALHEAMALQEAADKVELVTVRPPRRRTSLWRTRLRPPETSIPFWQHMGFQIYRPNRAYMLLPKVYERPPWAREDHLSIPSRYTPGVGVPLLVHRRCQEPMFGISNRIAYDSQMVHAAKPDKDGLIGRVLGTSLWFDIDGEADSKWCPAEGEAVVTMLRKIAAADIVDPDLFLITPFRIVAQEMRRRLEREAALFSAFRVEANEWVNDRVGTIHTVQGREAEAVILILGAPKASQNGARSWAAGTPNILNVAVSRAKQNLYVVGSHGAWSGVGHARELARALQRVRF